MGMLVIRWFCIQQRAVSKSKYGHGDVCRAELFKAPVLQPAHLLAQSAHLEPEGDFDIIHAISSCACSLMEI
jgi:hypothetical protein